MIAKYVLSKTFVTTELIELTYVTSQDYIINIIDHRNNNDFIGHRLPKDSLSTHGASHHAWATGPNHLNPGLPSPTFPTLAETSN